MAWSKLALSTPIAAIPALNQRIGIFSLTPWTPGVREGQGQHTWLSFPNAIDAVAVELAVLRASAALAIACAAASWFDLSAQIARLNAGFPLPELSRWQRHIDRLAVLESEKFSLMNAEISATTRAPTSLPMISRQFKKQSSQQKRAAASSIAGSDPLANLNLLAAAKQSHDAEVDSNLPAMAGGAGWRFYADSDLSNALRVGHPGSAMTRTAMLVFYGPKVDLAYLREMIT